MAGCAPDGSIVGEVENQPVDDLIQPIHAPEGQARQDQVPVAFFGLDRVSVEDERHERNDVPLKGLTALAQDGERLLCGCGRHVSSFT